MKNNCSHRRWRFYRLDSQTRPQQSITDPFRFSHKPIYLRMFLGLIGLAIAFDNLWLLMMPVPFAFVICYVVVGREEAYLVLKFAGCRSRVRRWL